jgi:hypothetical protein
MFDLGTVGNALQSLASIVVLLAILVSAGKHIQLLLSVGKLLEQLDSRFQTHCDDKTIHPDVPEQNRRLNRLEEAVFVDKD